MKTDAKTEINGIYKSPEGFLINKDNDALRAYKLRKQSEKEKLSLREDVNTLKSQMAEILSILKEIKSK